MIYIIVAVITLVIIGLIGYMIWFYNRHVKLNNKVNQSFSLVDVYLKKRFDLIPNLVNTVKGYASHEQKVMTRLNRLVLAARKTEDPAKSIELANKSLKPMSRLIALKEAYPELKANALFKKLMEELKNIEADISAARRIYNQNVTKYNTHISIFPNLLLTKMFKLSKKTLFNIDVLERSLYLDEQLRTGI